MTKCMQFRLEHDRNIHANFVFSFNFCCILSNLCIENNGLAIFICNKVLKYLSENVCGCIKKTTENQIGINYSLCYAAYVHVRQFMENQNE